jgi:beta-glucosidase
VLQVYVQDPVATVTRPVRELKAFARVQLPAGATRQVVFRIPTGQLGFYDTGLNYVVEPGSLVFHVGNSSRHLQEAGTISVIPDESGPVVKRFFGTAEVVQVAVAPE